MLVKGATGGHVCVYRGRTYGVVLSDNETFVAFVTHLYDGRCLEDNRVTLQPRVVTVKYHNICSHFNHACF